MAKSLREQVWQRARGRCEYCQMDQQFDVQPFQLDHIRSQKMDGPTSLENLSLACLPCNSYKGPNIAGYDPDTDTMHRLFNPRADNWDDHFSWDGPNIQGNTAIARTTIAVLKINILERMEHRHLLIAEGKFPVER